LEHDQRAGDGAAAEPRVRGRALTFSGGSGLERRGAASSCSSGSGVGGRTVPPKIFIAFPDAGQFYRRVGYVQGSSSRGKTARATRP